MLYAPLAHLSHHALASISNPLVVLSLPDIAPTGKNSGDHRHRRTRIQQDTANRLALHVCQKFDAAAVRAAWKRSHATCPEKATKKCVTVIAHRRRGFERKAGIAIRPRYLVTHRLSETTEDSI